jgi:MATE family multidrug resistance protein
LRGANSLIRSHDAPSHRWRAILKLSAPLVAFFLVQNLVGLAAIAMVGRLGDTALAGVGLGNVLFGSPGAAILGG